MFCQTKKLFAQAFRISGLAFGIAQMGLKVDFFEEWLPSCHPTVEARLVQCLEYCCHMHIKACSSFKVANGLLVASLISLILTCSSSSEGRPDLGRVLVVPFAFRFLMIVLTVLQGLSKAF